MPRVVRWVLTLQFIEQNIFKSVENVSLKTVIAYKDDETRHHFLDTYDEEEN